jgi:hypothetical protein
MTTLREAAQQALEALESTQLFAAHEHYPRRRVADTLDALRKALEQPEQEPVAFDALVAISLLTHLGGEVAEYADVVEAVRRLSTVNGELLEALKMAMLDWENMRVVPPASRPHKAARAAIAKAEGKV